MFCESEEIEKMALEEVRSLRRIRHPAVVDVLDVYFLTQPRYLNFCANLNEMMINAVLYSFPCYLYPAIALLLYYSVLPPLPIASLFLLDVFIISTYRDKAFT